MSRKPRSNLYLTSFHKPRKVLELQRFTCSWRSSASSTRARLPRSGLCAAAERLRCRTGVPCMTCMRGHTLHVLGVCGCVWVCVCTCTLGFTRASQALSCSSAHAPLTQRSHSAHTALTRALTQRSQERSHSAQTRTHSAQTHIHSAQAALKRT